jgi:ribosomal protein L40E
MTLPDFITFEAFNRLRRLMNAALPEDFASGLTINPLTYDDLDKALEGIEGITVEDIADVEVLSDGTLAYKKRRVLLYIRDRSGYRDHDPRELLPSFHVSDCRTLKRMRAGGRYERYVVSQRTDGRFKMNFLYGDGKAESEICKLKVCRDCLGFLSYKGYHPTDHKRHQIHSSFTLNEFFTVYPKSLISALPLHTDDFAPINHYAVDFHETSRRYRAENGWICENEHCWVDLSDPSYRRYLHTHHINAQKYDDRRENLKALCIRCHAEEPMHEHLKYSPEYGEFMKIYLRILQGSRTA